MSHNLNEALDSVYDFSAVVIDRKQVITSGGFADVYIVSHPQFGPLALKRPREPCAPGSQELRHLEGEAAIWRNLHHPNVLQFLGIHRDSETIYLVSPFLTNGTVLDYIHARPDSDRAGFILDLAMGLEYLHKCGIVHGDIKGRNMFVSSSIKGVVADFGLAKMVDTQTAASQRGQGTVRWESPELLDGGPRTFKSDVYAFGITVYEIITGNVPFAELSNNAVRRDVGNKKRPIAKPRVSSKGEWYTKEWAVAEAAWSHDPESRPSMAGILTVLRGPRKGPECRIKVLCSKFPQHNGYVSRRMHGRSGSHVVTQTAEDGLVIIWDPAHEGPKLFETINNAQHDLRWLAVRFDKEFPDFKRDQRLWATFTSASGTRGNIQVLPTPHTTGQADILTWSWSDGGNLTSHALGDTVEAAIYAKANPPHIFFCHKTEYYYGQTDCRAAVHFVLEELGPKD